MLEIRKANSVDTYNGNNFQLWKMHLNFIFQSRILFSIVNGWLKKYNLTNVVKKILWEKHDKHAILATIHYFHKEDVVNYSTSHKMWSKLQAYHDRHSDECIIALQDKYYSCKLREGELIATYISTLKILAKQITNMQHNILNNNSLSRLIVGYLLFFYLLLLAWDNVPLAKPTFLLDSNMDLSNHITTKICK